MTSPTTATIQAYFRGVAARMYQTVPSPPFTIFIHPDDPLVHLNYAIPDLPEVSDLAAPLAALKERFRARGRTPRFEYVEAFAPGLAAALAANGFVEEMRAYLMVVTPDRARGVAAVPGLSIRRLTAGSADEDLRAMNRIARAAFGMSDPDGATADDARGFLLGDAAAFLGLVDGRPAATATLLPSVDGLAEVAGVATLPELRRRGLGAALTAAAVALAFSRGLSAVVLSAGSAEAGRVYGSAGFEGAGTTLMYRCDG